MSMSVGRVPIAFLPALLSLSQDWVSTVTLPFARDFLGGYLGCHGIPLSDTDRLRRKLYLQHFSSHCISLINIYLKRR